MSAFEQYLTDECGYKDIRILNNGKEYIAIYPLLYTFAIIKGRVGYMSSFDDRWCYHNYQAAKKAIDEWDGIGEPNGWHRQPGTGRRRPDGDPTLEEVRW